MVMALKLKWSREEEAGSYVLCSMFYMHACYVVSMYESMIMMRILEDNFSYR